jgi:hypothetical protein
MTPTIGLRDLFIEQGTDKGCYAHTYEMLLRDRRHQIRSVLEIGVGTLIEHAHSSMKGYGANHYRPGGSLRAWRAYFPNAEIVGVDVQPDTQFTEDRIKTFLCDSTNMAAAAALLRILHDPLFDLIIDDGSHVADDQLTTLRNFFPALNRSGFYFIEDIGEDSSLYENPRNIEPFVNGASYFAISDNDPISGDKWKMIAIQKPPET